MKRKLSKSQSRRPVMGAFLRQLPEGLDRSVSGLRTTFLIAGLIAAAARTGQSADFLFAAGLLFQFAIMFENWWVTQRTH